MIIWGIFSSVALAFTACSSLHSLKKATSQVLEITLESGLGPKERGESQFSHFQELLAK